MQKIKLYVIKNLKKPLFWSTVILGIFSFILFGRTTYLATKLYNMDEALAEYSLYYDEISEEIYKQDSSESEKNSTSSSSSSSSSPSSVSSSNPPSNSNSSSNSSESTIASASSSSSGYKTMLESDAKDFASYFKQQINQTLSDSGVTETLHVEYTGTELLYVIVPQQYKYYDDKDIQYLADSIFGLKSAYFKSWTGENGFSSSNKAPSLIIETPDGANLAEEDRWTNTMKLSK